MPSPAYLKPYLDAVQRHGAGFESLLWANPASQAARFAALVRWCELENRVILDAGCGRADFLDYVLAKGIRPARYIGIEAVEDLAAAARHKDLPRTEIVSGDFIDDPSLLDRGADVVIFSGSLNTLSVAQFYQSLQLGWRHTAQRAGFQFFVLASTCLRNASDVARAFGYSQVCLRIDERRGNRRQLPRRGLHDRVAEDRINFPKWERKMIADVFPLARYSGRGQAQRG